MISTVTNYIIDRFDSDELVNTIAVTYDELIDTKKENIYPLVNIRFQGKNVGNDILLFDYTIHVLQQRDTNGKIKPSKLLEDTNYPDNINECDSIATNFVNYIRRFEIDLPITIESISDFEPLVNYGTANLDGFTFDLSLSMPNTGFCHV